MNGHFYEICTEKKAKILCEIQPPAIPGDNPTVTLTPVGQVVNEMTAKIPGIDKYVVMPNHVHMIIHVTGGKNVSQTIRTWKSFITKKIGKPIWQNSFYDHIIRDERDYLVKWKYIDDNPVKWNQDEYN